MELTEEQRQELERKKLRNRQHEHWLALPETQEYLSWLRQMAINYPGGFRTADDVAAYHARAIMAGTYAHAAAILEAPPHMIPLYDE